MSFAGRSDARSALAPGGWNVVVVGGGPAGILVTDILRRRRRKVLLLEAGPANEGALAEISATDPVWPFRAVGARAGWRRIYGLGGRTRIWGGWMARFAPYVFREGGWPFGERALAAH